MKRTTKTTKKKTQARGDGTGRSKARATASSYKAMHTPGPWEAGKAVHVSLAEPEAEFDVPSHVRRRFLDEQGRRCTQFIADCNMNMMEHAANARLIAAAPDLLAIAEAVDREVAHGECCPICSEAPHRSDCALTATLAKAEGRA